MSESRSKLIIDASLPDALRAALSNLFDLEPGHADGDAYRLSDADDARASEVLGHVGVGAGVFRRDDGAEWYDARLREADAAIRDRLETLATWAFTRWSGAADLPHPEFASSVIYAEDEVRAVFLHHGRYFQALFCPCTPPRTDGPPARIVLVLWDVTELRTRQGQLAAIDAAGAELTRIDAEEIKALAAPQRLKLLEDKIVHYVNDLLHFDNFEIRRLDTKTGQLILVTARGISPLKIGESMFAGQDDNGISGYVAATGESYYCPDTSVDPLYREGLSDAASSLTVPLKLHNQVIGVFNIESDRPDGFGPADRQFAEIFARYLAMALNTLDLLVAERITTNRQVSENVLGEIAAPFDDLERRLEALEDVPSMDDAARRKAMRDLLDTVREVRTRILECTGPQAILGADDVKVDRALAGRRVLVADDEPAIRKGVTELLTQLGCDVTTCANGGEAIRAIDEATDKPFDLVISDIKMPDYNGYEIFHATRQTLGDVPVVLMTGFGYDPSHSIIRASQEGLQAILFKPFHADQLVDEARKAMGLPVDG